MYMCIYLFIHWIILQYVPFSFVYSLWVTEFAYRASRGQSSTFDITQNNVQKDKEPWALNYCVSEIVHQVLAKNQICFQCNMWGKTCD